jgi:hypothetical protein
LVADVLTLRHVADLVRIPHIPLLSTGTYSLSTGEFTFTLEDLQAAAAAPANDPAVQWPRLKIDGLGDSFDPAAHGGEPAAGRIENMVVEGETLYGDYVVPPGLAAVIDWSFPSRSVEAVTGSMMGPTATGRTHELVITAVALLGVDLPGVSTLPDLMDVLATFSGEAPGQAVVMATVERPSERVEPVDASRAIRAGLDQELVRRRFFDLADQGAEDLPIPDGERGYDLWIRSLRFDDDGVPFLVVEAWESGRLYRYGFDVSGNDVTFALAGEVVEQYVTASAGAERRAPVAVWASRDESRAVMANRGGDVGMTDEQRRALAAGYGLDPDTATETDIMAAATAAAEARQADPPEPTPEPEQVPEPEPVPVAASQLPAGVVAIDAEELAALRQGAQTANTLAAERARTDRDSVLMAAMSQGRFAPARREHYERAWQADPEGTRHLLTASEADGGLAPNTIPVQARGVERQEGVNAGEGDDTNHEQYMRGFGRPKAAREVNGVRMISGG